MTDLLGPPWLGPAVRRRGQFTCYSPRSNHVLATPVRRPIDGGGVSGLACCSPGPAPSTREETADVQCGGGSGGARCLSLADYVMRMGPRRATAAGGG